MFSFGRRTLWWLTPLREGPVRTGCYLATSLLIFLVAIATIPLKQRFDFINSDGRWYYVYLPSLVIDGDLDFSNQIRDHWYTDPHPPLDQGPTPWHTDNGLIKNKYPVGLALTLTPAFLFAHTAALLLHALTGGNWCVPDGYSVPYQVVNLLFMLGLTVWWMRLIDCLLTEEFRANPAVVVLAVVVYWLGTPLLYYSFREPYMAHATGAFWISASVYLTWRLRQEVEQGRLPLLRLTLLAFCTTLAVVCRPTNVFVVPFHLWLLAGVVRRGMVSAFLARLPVALLGLAPVGVQMLVWHGLYGRWLHFSYEGEEFYWTNPACWQTLFSSRHGLFFWSPLLLAAVGGALWYARRGGGLTRAVLLCAGLSFVLLWYCNSSWWCWYFGDSFGGRAFLELSGLFVVGLAGAFEAVRRSRTVARRAFQGAVVVALVYHVVLFGLYSFHWITRSDYLF
jgi:hypothetical protein